MNEQPQPNLQPDQRPGEQPLYRGGEDAKQTFSGYDLTQPPVTQAPAAVPTPPAAPQAEREFVMLEWDASEYVHHTKGVLWYVGFVAIMLALLAIAYFLTQAWTFMVLVVVMAVAIGIFATRPPRTLHYALTPVGVQVENKTFNYSDFRAFGIIEDGALYSIMLIPTKRFMPAVSIYFDEADGEKIVDVLGARLPMEELHLDMVDSLMRRLRF